MKSITYEDDEITAAGNKSVARALNTSQNYQYKQTEHVLKWRYDRIFATCRNIQFFSP